MNRRRGEDPPRMVTRIPEAPTFDYWQLVPVHRRRLGMMPALPTPTVRSALPELDGHGSTRCFTGVCVRCGRTLISATGTIAVGTVCHRACRGRR